MDEEIQEMLDRKFITPVGSPWSFPCLLVKKKDGKWRVVADFRKLNDITEKYYFPLPRIDDTLHCPLAAKWLSKTDCGNASWQILFSEPDIKK